MRKKTPQKFILFLTAALLWSSTLNNTASAQSTSVSVSEISQKLNDLILDLGLENEAQQIKGVTLNQQPVISKKAGGTRTFIQASIDPRPFTNIRTRTAAMLYTVVKITAQMELDAIQVKLVDPRSDYLSYGQLSFAEDEMGCCGSNGYMYKNGFWEGEVTSYVPTNEQVEILQLWQEHRSQFQDANGITDEDRLKQFIAESSSYTVSDIEDAWSKNLQGDIDRQRITPELFQSSQ